MFGALLSASDAAGHVEDRIGEKLADVTLKTLAGEDVKLLDHHTDEILVVAYTGVGCPISGRYAPRLEELQEDFGNKGVKFVGINANPHNDLKMIKKEMEQLKVTFPVLKDADQDLTEQLDAKTTTEVFVVDKERVIRYRGMIDDQYAVGVQRDKPRNRYLKNAIREVLKGKDVHTSRTAAPGCLITRIHKPTTETDVTFTSHIAGIVQDNCQSCHREKQIAPFPLETYKEVRGWSAMIHSVLEEDRMPPWNADREHDGLFVNQRSLSESDKKLFVKWIEAGMPEGDPEKAPPPKEWPKRWRIGDPDKVFSMRQQFVVPKEGVVPYQYFTIPTNYREDKWIKAMEAQAGAEDVVHHILVFIVEPGKRTSFARLGLEDGFLCAQVPGDTPAIFPEGSAKRLPAGANLIMQVHYTTNGKARRDRCRLAMIFAGEDEEIKQEVKTRGIYNLDFTIPPGEPNYEVRAEHTFTKDTRILSFFPHMHFRGKNFKFLAHYPDDRQEVILNVPRYDYNWQESYILKEPMLIPEGTRLECIAHYDNSENNFANPDPTAKVRFGEQTWDEMMFGYIDYLEGGRESTSSAHRTSDYEIIVRKKLNDARIVEVATNKKVDSLREIADRIIADERDSNPYMVRVFFYFSDEQPGDIVPRYRVEWTEKETRIHDFTDDRKNADLRFE
jgi:peroxiredoxin